ncbi:zinc finger protein 664 [Drosophila takahashii]|uniref:zinc finger protein 664 n=1 Tax=Drosophila takahashii TaxID=29030 RepID=UPI001CF8FA09|nr:zinc finger protein 93 [Drosophila takahashii]
MPLTRETARELCRTCLLPLNRELQLQQLQEEIPIPISQELRQLLHMDLDQDEEDLPQELCLECRLLVENFERFRRKAEDSRRQLEEMLKREQDAKEPTFEVVYEEGQADEGSLHSLEPPEPEPDPDPIARTRRTTARNTLKCSLCRHSFAHQITLAAHVRKVHEGSKRPYQCDQCDKAYSFMGGLYTHIREVHAPQERRHPCDQPGCERIYTSRIAMQKHKRLKHSPRGRDALRKFICEQCGASFNQSANLKFHLKTKHPTEDEVSSAAGERHFCEICQKEFHSRYTLKYHTLQQHEVSQAELPHECQVCGRRMAKKFMLLQHMLKHSSEKLPCEHCGRPFARRFELEAHVQAVHLKLKPFACGHCPESFASRKTLRHHEYIHTGEKPYVCGTCGQAFRQQTCLKNHRKVHDKSS